MKQKVRAIACRRGWKRKDKQPICDKCWRAKFVLRAIVLPVAGPIDRDWNELRVALDTAWSQTTGLSNWLMTELYARDVRREPKMERLPPMSKVYLYPEARRRFPDLAPYTVTALEHAITRKYRAARFKILWTSEASLPSFRYPTPYPLPRQAWKPHFGNDNIPLVTLKLGSERWTLRLRGGHEFRRQLVAFRKMVLGAAVRAEVCLYRVRANRSDHRSGVQDRRPGGDQRAHYRTMCKMVAWLPREKPSENKEGTMIVHTASDCFWYASVDGHDSPWRVNADHVRRWQYAHERSRVRLAEDYKPGKRAQHAIDRRRSQSSAKYRRRIDTFCHEVTAQLAKFAQRQRVARVILDDDERSYLPDFPWHRIHELLEEKLDERGIAFGETSPGSRVKSQESRVKSQERLN